MTPILDRIIAATTPEQLATAGPTPDERSRLSDEQRWQLYGAWLCRARQFEIDAAEDAARRQP